VTSSYARKQPTMGNYGVRDLNTQRREISPDRGNHAARIRGRRPAMSTRFRKRSRTLHRGHQRECGALESGRKARLRATGHMPRRPGRCAAATRQADWESGSVPVTEGAVRLTSSAENRALRNAHLYALTCILTHVLKLGRNSPRCVARRCWRPRGRSQIADYLLPIVGNRLRASGTEQPVRDVLVQPG
jgi:hypothetical protein